MCGIFLSSQFLDKDELDVDSTNFQNVCSRLQSANALRGPDAQSTYKIRLEPVNTPSKMNPNRFLAVDFYASELRLRGDSPIVQPHVEDGNVLCWNGEIFDGIEIQPDENDGSKIFGLLCSTQTEEEITAVLSTLEGPYAFVFYHARSQRLYFARDPLGRRSLLVHQPSDTAPYLLLSSVTAGVNVDYEFAELSTEHMFSLEISTLRNSTDVVEGYKQALQELTRTPSHAFTMPGRVNTEIPPETFSRPSSLDEIPGFLSSAVDGLIMHLDRSVMLRVRNIPRQSMTGGKARVGVLFSGGIDCTVITYMAHKHIPLDEPIDLLNVAFENPRKIQNQRDGVPDGVSRNRPKKKQPTTIPENDYESYRVPDRLIGMTEVEELRRICPGRTWNFVEVNVPYEECQAIRPLVMALILPGRTVMDLSLALALYFASRGRGQIRETSDSIPVPYTSEARVLLNGLGSDELLGGYGRHRTVYSNGGWEALISELQQEIDRLPTRNLGRDDRVISSHGKEARHPFLSLTLVSYLASLPVHFKMDPLLELGFGDKMLLRLAARKLGLVEASSRKKRAMQFGSHSARMDTSERRGDLVIDKVDIYAS